MGVSPLSLDMFKQKPDDYLAMIQIQSYTRSKSSSNSEMERMKEPPRALWWDILVNVNFKTSSQNQYVYKF